MSDKPSPPLVKDDRVVGTYVYVGTNVWFEHWLADPKLKSFRYECPQGSFTARRRKGDYWNAYRKVKGKLRQEYLGQSSALTQTKLIETARTLAMDNTEYWPMKYPRPEQPSQPSQESTGLYNQSADCITEPDSKETTNAVRQWCVFARHNDGKLQFMGGYWSKGDAEARMHKSQRERQRSESIGDKPYIGPPPTYEVREMLVAPVDLYNQSADCITEVQANQVEQLEAEVARLKESLQAHESQIKKLQYFELENSSVRDQNRKLWEMLESCQAQVQLTDPSSLFNQLSPLLKRLNDRERRAIQQKLEEILG